MYSSLTYGLTSPHYRLCYLIAAGRRENFGEVDDTGNTPAEMRNKHREFRRVLAASVEEALDFAAGAYVVLHTRPGGEVVGAFELGTEGRRP
jgi:hypothetical protein